MRKNIIACGIIVFITVFAATWIIDMNNDVKAANEKLEVDANALAIQFKNISVMYKNEYETDRVSPDITLGNMSKMEAIHLAEELADEFETEYERNYKGDQDNEWLVVRKNNIGIKIYYDEEN